MHTVVQSQHKNRSQPWLVISGASKPAMRLFCFAHAGGNAASFHHWHQQLPSSIQVCAIQLPGRGMRMAELPLSNFEAITRSITQAIEPYLDVPFAFFGHSMGALLGFEVARELRRRKLNQPYHLFASASRAPHLPMLREPLHNLPPAQFREKLGELNGTPKEALANEELMSMIEPVLRADFKACETRQYYAEASLNIPITVFGGDNDPSVGIEKLQAWKHHTDAGFWLRTFPGDHFYITEQQDLVLKQVSELLCLAPRMAI